MDMDEHRDTITLRNVCLSHDQPEVRAKTSKDVFALLEQHSRLCELAAETPPHQSASHDMAASIWCIVLIGVSDSWPLVSQAFIEQFHQHCAFVDQTLSDTPHQCTFGPRDLDQILNYATSSSLSAQEQLRIASGALILAKEQQTLNGLPQVPLLGEQNIAFLAKIISQGWQTSHDLQTDKPSEDATRSLHLLVQILSETMLITALGSTSSSLNLEKTSIYIKFLRTALKLTGEKQSRNSIDKEEMAPTCTAKSWTLVHWICGQLQIPTWFESKTEIYSSAHSLEQAKLFVHNATMLLECLDMLIDLQTMDNTITLHKTIIAAASFTNPRDTWMASALRPLGSEPLTTLAHTFLNHLHDSTPWTVPHTSSCSSTPYPKDMILIPGTFSDTVMQVLDQTRQYFTNRRATQMTQRAKVVVDAHQQALERQQASRPEMAIKPLRTSGIRPTFKITDAGDEAIELEEQSVTTIATTLTVDHQHPYRPYPRWDRERLESLAIVEWCAQQRVDNPAMVQPMLMQLLAPILGCIESNVLRYQVRALQLLKRFLTMYHPLFKDIKSDSSHLQSDKKHTDIPDACSSHIVSAKAATLPAYHHSYSNRTGVNGDPLIWIKIFERTGLDQVFARALRPLLHPLRPQADPGTTPGAAVTGLGEQVFEPGTTAQQAMKEELEMTQTAFQTYLVLLAVSTENRVGMAKDEEEILEQQRSSVSPKQGEPLFSVEELFIAGALGSTLTVNPSDQYRTLILDWMNVLLKETIDGTELMKEIPSTPMLSTISSDTNVVLQGLGRRTIKHLPAVVRFLCEIIELPVPTTPLSRVDAEALSTTNTRRKLRLELLYHATVCLQTLIHVAQARIWRYRGRILAAIAACWAGSRLLDLTSSSSLSQSPLSSSSNSLPANMGSGHSELDKTLIEITQVLYNLCRKHTDRLQNGVQELAGCHEQADTTLGYEDGFEKDISCLQQLDPAMFGPLFKWT